MSCSKMRTSSLKMKDNIVKIRFWSF